MQIRRTHYNDAQHTDLNSLSRAMVNAPDKIGPYLTFLMGQVGNKAPLVTLTEGVKNTKWVKGLENEYNVFGDFRYTTSLAYTVAGSNVGIGGQMFNLPFPDKWFIESYTLVSPSGRQARISGPPIPDGSSWLYPMVLIDPSGTDSVPASDLVAGATWAQMYANVGTDYSRGNASNWQIEGKVRNKIGTLRKSYTHAGRIKDQVVEVDLPKVGGGKTRRWVSFEEWQFFEQWQMERASYMWYGKQSYNEDGYTNLRDQNTNKPVIVSPGLIEQIQWNDTYSIMTESKLRGIFRDLFFAMRDRSDFTQLVLYTGTGGMEEFDNAMKQWLGNNNWTIFDGGGRFVEGSGFDMKIGAYFRTYRHIDGRTITVVHEPAFDDSPKARASGRHPRTGLPLESYRMVLLDQSTYAGVPNIQQLKVENRDEINWHVSGSTVPLGYPITPGRASDIDGYSVHYLSEFSIVMYRFNTSVNLECVA